MSEIELRLLSTQLSKHDITGAFSVNTSSGPRVHFITYNFNNFKFCVTIDDHIFNSKSPRDSLIILENIVLNDMAMVQYLLFNSSTYKGDVNLDYQALCAKIHESINFMEVLDGIHFEYRVAFDVVEDYISKLFNQQLDWIEIYHNSLLHFRIDLSKYSNEPLLKLIADS